MHLPLYIINTLLFIGILREIFAGYWQLVLVLRTPCSVHTTYIRSQIDRRKYVSKVS